MIEAVASPPDESSPNTTKPSLCRSGRAGRCSGISSTSVQTEAVTADVSVGVLVKVEGLERAAEAGLEISQQCVDPAELGQIAGVFAAGNDGLMAAVCGNHGAKAGETVSEHCSVRIQGCHSP